MVGETNTDEKFAIRHLHAGCQIGWGEGMFAPVCSLVFGSNNRRVTAMLSGKMSNNVVTVTR
jgi:hypothetical protein